MISFCRKSTKTLSTFLKAASITPASPSAPPHFLFEPPDPDAVPFSFPSPPPLAASSPPAKEDIKSEVLLSPFKEKPFTGRGELFSVLTYTPWTRARLRALAKGFPDPSQGPLGCREYELAIQTRESGFADMYPVIQLFLSESKARQWIEKAEWKQPLTNFDFRVNYSFIPEFFPKAIA